MCRADGTAVAAASSAVSGVSSSVGLRAK